MESTTDNQPEDSGNFFKPEAETAQVTEEYFPPKPALAPMQQTLTKSLVSLAMFIGIFYLLFNWDLTHIMTLAGVILIHELGHFGAMNYFGYKDTSIFFVPLVGAFAAGSKDQISQKQEVIVLLAGPVPGILIGVLMFYFGDMYDNDKLLMTSNIFVFINLFNLLPFMPLDGGRVIKTLFFDSNEVINKVFIVLSILVMAGLAYMLDSLYLLIVPFFLGMQLLSQAQVDKARKGVRSIGISLKQSFNDLSDKDYWLIREQVGKYVKATSRQVREGVYEPDVDEGRIIKQVTAILQNPPVNDLSAMAKIGVLLLWVFCFVAPLILIASKYMDAITSAGS